MPLRITYWTASKYNPNVPGAVIYSESLAISGTSAQSGATPPNAVFVSLRNTETGDVNFAYDSASPTAVAAVSSASATGGVAAAERIWLDAVSTYKVAGITSS
jgi:hypothetical protein